MRALFWVLAAIAMVVGGAGWSDLSRLNTFRDRDVREAEEAQAKLKQFSFDAKGNVPPEKREEFERTMGDLRVRTDGLRGTNQAIANAQLYAYGGTGAAVLLGVLGFVVGRKKAASAAPPIPPPR